MNIITESKGFNHLNCFWYYDQIIAMHEISNTSLYVESTGELEVYLPVDKNSDYERLYKGHQAVEHAEMLGYTDNDIHRLITDDKFQLSNWFIFKYKERNIEIELDNTSTEYNEAIEILDEYIDEML